MRVLITDLDLGDPGYEVARLERELGAQVRVARCASEAEVLREIEEFDPHALLVQWAPITAAVLAAASSCRLISRVGIGIDMIDTAAAREREIEVRNVPDYCVEEVAGHAVALGLALWRRLPQFDAEVRAGAWDAATGAPTMKRLSTATVGLFGFGRIGTLVGRAYAAMGARVLVCDPYATDIGYQRASFDNLLRESDLISVHAPLTDDTRHAIDGAALARTRRQPILVNTSRGPIIDAHALNGALRDGTVSGAGLDVFDSEPLPADSPLRTAPNTILTPHASWCSREAMPALRAGAVQNIIDAFAAAERS
ncbi:C-terminal binding protein [Nocardia panacis]|uniref:C-terminal binding protein n=1 Tax=Nocardia panacis TaxID=2340916 RepID=UPI0013156437|nr:C-terminal binding protein [Nocardia panacis]